MFPGPADVRTGKFIQINRLFWFRLEEIKWTTRQERRRDSKQEIISHESRQMVVDSGGHCCPGDFRSIRLRRRTEGIVGTGCDPEGLPNQEGTNDESMESQFLRCRVWGNGGRRWYGCRVWGNGGCRVWGNRPWRRRHRRVWGNW